MIAIPAPVAFAGRECHGTTAVNVLPESLFWFAAGSYAARAQEREEAMRYLLLAITALALSGCYSTARLHENSDEAARRLLDVRPRAEVSGIEPGLWMSERDFLDAKAGLEDSLIHSTERLLRAQLPLLLRLGLLTEADTAELDAVSGLGDAAHFGAFAVPETGRFFVKPGGESVELCIHEIAHIVSYRFGYMDGWPVAMRGEKLDARWIDLDALLAAWALDEAVAEVTEEVATLHAKGGEVRKFWDAETSLGSRLAANHFAGPISISYADGRELRVEAGTYVHESDSIARRLLNFVYRASQRAVTHGAEFPAAPDGAVDLDLAFARVWQNFSFTTRQVLFPEGEHSRSRFAARFRESGLIVAGATRVGAFAVHEFVMRRADLPTQDPLEEGLAFVRLEDWNAESDKVRALRDDILLRDANDALLWIVAWDSDEAADWFAETYRAAMPDADTRRDGRIVIVNVDGFENADATLALLLTD